MTADAHNSQPEPRASARATPQSPMDPADSKTVALRKGPIVFLAFAAIVTAAIAWARVGMLDLPSAPRDVTATSSGLAELEALGALDQFVRGGHDESELMSLGLNSAALVSVKRARQGFDRIDAGDVTEGLAMMAQSVRAAPSNLVFGNAYRMAVFQLQRDYLSDAHRRGVLTPSFPDHLHNQPIALFESLAKETGTREVRLQLALAWIDKMLLFPALEIKAPSSVESVKLLTGIIEDGNAGYVPALFARGLNHLHRPARLVWPESDKTPPDAAARDIGMCVSIGRRLGLGSSRLQAHLSIALGDAYVKAGRLNVARSWWQIAQNLCHNDDVQDSIRKRFGWRDEEALDLLEMELDRARSALDTPMTDLAMMWN